MEYAGGLRMSLSDRDRGDGVWKDGMKEGWRKSVDIVLEAGCKSSFEQSHKLSTQNPSYYNTFAFTVVWILGPLYPTLGVHMPHKEANET